MTAHWTPDAMPDLSGRRALITGATSGIGLETARTLAVHGADVILAGRNEAALRTATAAVLDAAPTAKPTTLVLDLASLASIKAAAARIADTETIDILINNAGVMNLPERRTTTDGFEMTFGTNHLGHYAFDAQIWPALVRSTAARVVTVSAMAARWRIGRLTDVMSEERYGPMRAYAKSKRANVVYTLELARRTSGGPIAAVVVEPGAAPTNLQRHSNGALVRLLTPMTRRMLMGTPEGAAWPSLYAATSPDVGNGDFIGPAARDQTSGTPKSVRLPKGADDPAEGAMLWSMSERLTGVAFR